MKICFLDKPVLENSPEEQKYLQEAVSDVVRADSQVPESKKEEATKLAVKQITEGFRASQMTEGQLIDVVEMEAAKRNATVASPATPAANDRSWHHHGFSKHGFKEYYPSYYPSFGYRDCLRRHSYRYCRRRLYGGKSPLY